MGKLSLGLKVSVTERLLPISVMLIVVVFCFYWAARRDRETIALAVKRVRPRLPDAGHLFAGPETPCSFDGFRAGERRRPVTTCMLL